MTSANGARLRRLVIVESPAKAKTIGGYLGKDWDVEASVGHIRDIPTPSEMPADQNQEGVPNSMLEAMATGLPVVATLHGGIPEAVTHEQDGLLVPERDPAALHAALEQITAD